MNHYNTTTSPNCQQEQIERDDSLFSESWNPNSVKSYRTSSPISIQKDFLTYFSTIDQKSSKENYEHVMIQDLIASPSISNQELKLNSVYTNRTQNSTSTTPKQSKINFADIQNILNLTNRSTNSEKLFQSPQTASSSQQSLQKLQSPPKKIVYSESEDLKASILNYFKSNQAYYDIKEVNEIEDQIYDFAKENNILVLRKLCQLLYDAISFQQTHPQCQKCQLGIQNSIKLFDTRETFDCNAHKVFRKKIFQPNQKQIENIILDDMINNNIQLQNEKEKEIMQLRRMLEEANEVQCELREQIRSMEIEKNHQINMLNQINKDLEISKTGLIRDMAYLEKDLNVCVKQSQYNKAQSDLKDQEIKTLLQQLERITLILEKVQTKQDFSTIERNTLEGMENDKILEYLIAKTKKQRDQINIREEAVKNQVAQIEAKISPLRLKTQNISEQDQYVIIEENFLKYLKGTLQGDLGTLFQTYFTQVKKMIQDFYVSKYQKAKINMQQWLEEWQQKFDSFVDILISVYEIQPHIMKMEKSELEIPADFFSSWKNIINIADNIQDNVFNYQKAKSNPINFENEKDLQLF